MVNNKPASTYAAPKVSADTPDQCQCTLIDDLNMAAGSVLKGNFSPIKKDGVTMRGYGAATKGIKSRGPMA